MSSSIQPIGWNSAKMNMHFRAVYPNKDAGGMQLNLHRNMSKNLLPKELNLEETRNIEAARRILYRQRIGCRIFVGGKNKDFLKEWKKCMHLPKDQKPKPETAPEEGAANASKGFLPTVHSRYPSTPNSRYSADDVALLVERLSKTDPEKVPGTKGYPVKLPKTIVYKKKYTDDEIQTIVRRLSQYDVTKHPPMSRGNTPMVVNVFPRQTMTKVNKSSSEEVQEVVERLSKYDNTRAQTVPDSRTNPSHLDSLD